MESGGNYIKNIQAEPLAAFGPSKFVLSSLKSYHKQHSSSPLSLKIVANGTETYRVGNDNYTVKTDQYFIVNQQEEVTIDVDTKENTDGICIYPPMELFQGALQNLTAKSSILPEETTPEKEISFTHKINRIESSLTGQFLKQSLPHFQKCDKVSSHTLLDFYTDLAEVMVKDQLIVNNELKQLKPLRKTTREELYRRLSVAKDYIHDHQSEKIQIDRLAEVSCLSKYHFLRSFKDLFGRSPYQYSIELKLNLAEAYRAKGLSYPHINEIVGFSDPKNLKRALQKRALVKT